MPQRRLLDLAGSASRKGELERLGERQVAALGAASEVFASLSGSVKPAQEKGLTSNPGQVDNVCSALTNS